MSYCRMGKQSDVHAIESSMGIMCVACKLTHQPDKDVENVTIRSHESMLQHLAIHKASGHKVPNSAIRQIQSELNAKNQIQKTWSKNFRKCPKHVDVLVHGQILQEHSHGNWKQAETATVVARKFHGNEFTLAHNYFYVTDIRATHWMHIPTAPEITENKPKGKK